MSIPTTTQTSSALHCGLKTLGADDVPAPLLAAYIGLLHRWNRAYNLTAVRDPLEMVSKHILDSLAILPFLGPPHPGGKRVLDIGSGPGLPGIPLAIARPDLAFTLLDANAKKTRFMTQAAHELGLKNVEVIQSRAETYAPVVKFDRILARAFGTLAKIILLAEPLAAPGARVVAMKGAQIMETHAGLPHGWIVEQAVALTVPGLPVGSRHAVVLARG